MGISEILFPVNCLACGVKGRYLCSKCLIRVRAAESVCPMCDKPSIDGFTHTRCKRKYRLDGLTSIWRYEGVIRKALIRLKYNFARDVARELVTATYNFQKRKGLVIPNYSVIVPIPLHVKRENWRGFNQSEILSSLYAILTINTVNNDLLVRTKNVRSQTELNKDERLGNIKGVFATNKSFKDKIPKEVLLFDDVYTTGATMKEAAKVLKRSGVEKVWGLTIAS